MHKYQLKRFPRGNAKHQNQTAIEKDIQPGFTIVNPNLVMAAGSRLISDLGT